MDLAAGDEISGTDRVGIHCTPKRIIEVDADGRPIGISYDALRIDSDGVSSSWLEFYDSTGPEAVCCTRLYFPRRVNNNDVMAVLSIENIRASTDGEINVIYTPIDGYESHASLIGFTGDAERDDILRQSISTDVSIITKLSIAKLKPLQLPPVASP